MSASQVLHTHCSICVNARCVEKVCPPYSCEVINCPTSCGAQFHKCKEEDHLFCCANEKVPCINSGYGCPAVLPRHQCGVHLRVCPASVVQCSAEWNRWPVYSPERKARVPFVGERQFHARYGQLDVAMALRDQRMLQRAMKAPRSVRRALRNNLTRRFPAVPIIMKTRSMEQDRDAHDVSSDEASCTSDDDSDAPWNKSKDPPGLVASICNELFRRKQTEMKILNGEKNDIELSDDPANLDQPTCDKKECSEDLIVSDNKANESTAVPSIPAPPYGISLMLQEILSLDLNMEFLTRYQAKPNSMYTFLCGQLFRRDEYPWHVKNMHSDGLMASSGWVEERCPLATEGCTYSFRRFHPTKDKRAVLVYNDIVESFGVRPHVESSLLSQRESLERDYAEYLLRTRGKEPTPEIHTSGNPQSTVQVHGNLYREIPDRRRMSKDPGCDLRPDPLTSLPAEIIRYIAKFLDGFSLCNLSLTCTWLRSVCCTLLEEKGIVVQEWKRKGSKANPRWVESTQVWLFSTACEPIRTWGFLDHAHLSEHLKTCPFNTKLERNVPIRTLPRYILPREVCEIRQVLERMYPNMTWPLEDEFQTFQYNMEEQTS